MYFNHESGRFHVPCFCSEIGIMGKVIKQLTFPKLALCVHCFQVQLCSRSLKVYIANTFNFQVLLSRLKFSIITI